MASLRNPGRWPPAWWYGATVAYVAAIAALAAWLYWAVNGDFWTPFLWGIGLGTPWQLYAMRRQLRRRKARTP